MLLSGNCQSCGTMEIMSIQIQVYGIKGKAKVITASVRALSIIRLLPITAHPPVLVHSLPDIT